MTTKYEMDTLELECEIGDLVPATLVAWEFIEAMINGCKVPAGKSVFGAHYDIDRDRVEAALFVLGDLRRRALRLSKIFHGPDEDEEQSAHASLPT